jgi:hypothetical protein
MAWVGEGLGEGLGDDDLQDLPYLGVLQDLQNLQDHEDLGKLQSSRS